MKAVKFRDVLALIFLAAWPFIYYWPVTIGRLVFAEGDINWLFLPIRTELARALSEGRLPLWSPGLQAGFPLFAEGEVAALYPLNLIAYRLFPAAAANSLVILFNFAWASVGMYLLARSFGLRIASAFLAGFVFGFSGFMTAQLSHIPHLTVAVWLPWLIFLQSRIWRAKAKGKKETLEFILMSFAIGFELLGGFPQLALINLGVYVLSGIFAPILWIDYRNAAPKGQVLIIFRSLPKTVGMSLLPLILGIGIAAVQLLPTFELIGLSIRGQGMGKTFFTSYSLDPAYLTQFIAPFASLGQPNALNMEYWSYLGILPLFLALLAVVRRRDARTMFLCLLALLALALAIGGNNPLYNLLYYVPVFNRFRVPARFLFVFTFAMAFLAAIGLEDLLNRSHNPRSTTWQVRALPILAIAVGVGAVHLAYEQPQEWWVEIWRWVPFVLIAASFGLVLITKTGRAQPNVLGSLVIGLTVLDLAAFSAPFLSNLASMAPMSDLVQAPRTVLAMDNVQTAYRVIVDKHPYTMASTRASLWENIPLTYNKQGIKSYLPSLALQRNEAYVNDMTLNMRNLINVRYYLLPLETLPFGDPLPSLFDVSEPYGGLTLKLLSGEPSISPTSAVRLELTSYTDQTQELENVTPAGEITLRLDDGESKTLPIRLGMETADWAYDGIASVGKVKHTEPGKVLSFPAYLKSVGHTFDGHKYLVRYDLAAGGIPQKITAVGLRSFLPDSQLTVERLALIDKDGRSASLVALLHQNEMSLAFRSHTAGMWENQDVLPRAFFVNRAEIVSDAQVLDRMKQPSFRPDQVVFLADDDHMGQDVVPVEGKAIAQVSIADYKSERVVVNATTDRAGYLVLTDSWYPGWTASVDGNPAPIYRADYIFRAVPLMPGQHSVVFEYQPASFRWGAFISVLSVAACMILAVVLRK